MVSATNTLPIRNRMAGFTSSSHRSKVSAKPRMPGNFANAFSSAFSTGSLMVSRGRKVALPSLPSFRYRIACFAASADRITRFWAPAPNAVSTAVTYSGSTEIKAAAGPITSSRQRSLPCMTAFTPKPNPSSDCCISRSRCRRDSTAAICVWHSLYLRSTVWKTAWRSAALAASSFPSFI